MTVILAWTVQAGAQNLEPGPDACPPGEMAGILISSAGKVSVDGKQAARGHAVCTGQTVTTGNQSRAALRLSGVEAPFRLRENSSLVAPPPPEDGKSVIELITGWIYVLGKPRRDYQINTPFITAGIEGTEFAVNAGPNGTEIYLFEGEIEALGGAAQAGNETSLDAGSKLIIARDGTLSVEKLDQSQGTYAPLRAAGRDVVAWALYYPDVLASGELAEVQGLLNSGSIETAKDQLASLPETGASMALSSILATSQENLEQGETLANRAITQFPESAAGYLALSYALQARFALGLARDAAERGVEAESGNALAWARLAELELMLGDRARSRISAEKASQLSDNGRTAIVEGFTALAERRAGRAGRRFSGALAFDSQDPLAWLGQGLTQILQGNVTDGRESLENAVLHDPNSALIRAYLGKSYFEERRAGDAETQYAIAKDLDPADPTPYFYDAILKQLDNRPIEALFALDQAIARNDNRAVYRSRLLLDSDLAARNASLAEIYREIGFDESAINRASQALATAPQEFSAHRFLGQAYADRPRFEIARSSEEATARLLRPFGHDLVRPSTLFNDLNLRGQAGPSALGINEYNQLFDRASFTGSATIAAGENSTLADEVVVSGLAGWLQVSAGQFHFETDGSRPNNDIEHDITTLYAQAEISPSLKLEAEIRDRRTVNGDISSDFEEPDVFAGGDRDELDELIGRIGARLELSPGSSIVGSAGISENKEVGDRRFAPITFAVRDDIRRHSAELQYLYDGQWLDVTIGGHWLDRDSENRQDTAFDFPFPPPSSVRTHQNIGQFGGYAYGYLDLTDDLSLTLGLSYDTVDRDDDYRVDRISPKLGAQWEPAAWLSAYATLARVTSRDVAFGQTIEPVSIAGTTQFFDDDIGTRTDVLGGRIELRPISGTSFGIAGYARRLERPISSSINGQPARFIFEDEEELDVSLYGYQVLTDRLSLGTTYSFRHVDLEPASAIVDTPENLETSRAILSLNYFSSAGFFTKVKSSYVHQSVNRQQGITRPEGDDEEFFIDAELGFRLPNRRGVVSLSAVNLLDRSMRFQDEDFRTTRQTTEVIALGRSVIARATLQF